MIVRSEHRDIHRRALMQDDGRYFILTLAALSSTISFGAIFAQLANIKEMPASAKGLHIGLALATIRRLVVFRPHDLRAALRA